MAQKTQQRSCRCERSQCKKLYCECLAAGVQCTAECGCVDCHNRKEQPLREKPQQRQHRGCSCRKSFCVKKYCECYQQGILCNQNCKCVDCQNSESFGNRRVINELRNSPATALYSIVLSPSQTDLEHMLEQSDAWLDASVQQIIQAGKSGDVLTVADTLIKLLKQFQMGKNTHLHVKNAREDSEEIIQEE